MSNFEMAATTAKTSSVAAMATAATAATMTSVIPIMVMNMPISLVVQTITANLLTVGIPLSHNPLLHLVALASGVIVTSNNTTIIIIKRNRAIKVDPTSKATLDKRNI
jgi:hypothetical protein